MGWMPRRLMLLAGSALLLAPLLAVQLSAGAGRAEACSCPPLPPPTEEFGYVDAVFSGRVVGSGGEYSLKHFASVEIEVDTVWKGSVTSTTFVYVWFGASCGYDRFEVGKDFLVYAEHNVFRVEDESTLFIHQCSRTRPLEYAKDDLQVLGAGRIPEPGITAAMPTSGDAERAATRGPADAGQAANREGESPDPVTTEGGSASVDPLRSLAWWAPLLAGLAAAALIIRRWAQHREPE